MTQKSTLSRLRAWAAVHEGVSPVLGIAVMAGATYLTSGTQITSFIIAEYAQSVPFALLLPLLAAYLISINATYEAADLAHTAPRMLQAPRAMWLIGLTIVYGVATSAPCFLAPCEPAPILRNLLLFTAVAVLGITCIGSALGWIPLGLYSTSFLFFGQKAFGQGDPVRWWAIPMREDVTVTDAAACLVLYLAALVIYGLRGDRDTARRW